LKKNNTKTAYFIFLSIALLVIFILHYQRQGSLKNTHFEDVHKKTNIQTNKVKSKNETPQSNRKLAAQQGLNKIHIPQKAPLERKESVLQRQPVSVRYNNTYEKILKDADLVKNYKYDQKDIKIYKKKRGNFRWIRVQEEVDKIPIVTRADQFLMRLFSSSDSATLESWMKAKEPSFQMKPFIDGLYIVSISQESAQLKYEEVVDLLLSKTDWVESVSADFIYTR